MKSRKLRFYHGVLAIILASISWFSCTKADVPFGEQWVDNDYTKVNMVDTFTAELSTVYLDSFATNSTGYGLIGVYKDPELGIVNASTYARLQPPSITQSITDSLRFASFDSVVVFLKLKNNEYGDTTQNMRLNVYQLAQNINYLDNTSYLYNNTSFTVNSTPLGSRDLTLNPNVGQPKFGDTLTIRLNDDFGKDLFTKLRSYSLIMQNSTNFLNYFSGLKISAEASNNNGFMMNVADSMSIRIYYDVQEPGDVVRKYSEFTLNDKAYQFNNISIDRSGTELGQVGLSRLNRTISSTVTNNRAYLQLGTRTAIKISFPSIRDLTYQSNYLRLTKAILMVQPVTGTYLPYFMLPSSLYIGQTNSSNAYTESSGTAASPYQDAATRLYTYSWDLTTYINTYELPYQNLDGRGLILYMPAATYKSQFNRLIAGDAVSEKAGNGGVKLQLYYISVK